LIHILECNLLLKNDLLSQQYLILNTRLNGKLNFVRNDKLQIIYQLKPTKTLTLPLQKIQFP